MTLPPAPFSYRVKVGHVAANPLTVTMEADAADLLRLATVWKVPEVRAFSATAKLTRWKRDGIKAKGHVSAVVVQDCVVTLEPVESTIDEDFETIFVPEGSSLARIAPESAGEIFLDPDGPDLPDTFTGDSVDIGASAAEFAALAIDPYPRKPGVEFAGHREEDGTNVRPSPFAALKSLKNDKTGD